MICPSKYFIHALIAFILAILATVFVEHSLFDITMAKLLYQDQGQWLIAKSHVGFDLLFYTVPKRLLIIFELYIIIAWAYFYKKQNQINRLPKIFYPVASLSVRELGFLAVAMLSVPTVVATLKGITQTPCPVSLTMFGGDLPYLTIMENIKQNLGGRCFPAAHASSGFALYALCFVPSLCYRRLWQWALLLAWLMGGYKMAIGDHFFSHTLVSMCLAWAICAGMAWVVLKK